MTELKTVLGIVADGGVLAVLVLGLLGFLRGYVVPRWLYNDKKAECDEWKQAYKTLSEVTRTMVRSRP